MSLLLLLLPSALLQLAAGLRSGSPRAEAGSVEIGPGKLYLLMLANQGIEWEEIWVRFLAGGEPGVSFEAFMHCEDGDACKKSVKRQDLFTIIPTVPSRYCDDLISPMMALLAAAVRSAGKENPYDKFVFVSHNSLPVKPFPRAHQLLTHGLENSAIFDLVQNAPCWASKHSQWFALSYWYAETMLTAARNTKSFDRSMVHVPEGCNFSCVDEAWPIATLFHEKVLQNIHVTGKMPLLLQARRIMWALWPNQLGHHTANEDPVWVWGKAKMAPAERGVLGPVLFRNVSAGFLGHLRHDKEVVFMRKVDSRTQFNGDLSLPDAWDTYAFTEDG